MTPVRPPRTGGTSTLISPPGTPRNPYSLPGYTNATGNGGQTRVPITATPAVINWNNGFGPNQPIGENTMGAPTWWTGPTNAWGATASKATGLTTFVNGKQVVVPVPEAYKNMVIPWQYVGKALPIGAFTSLFPNARGNDWSKVRPAGWGEGWLPTGPARQ